MLQLIAQSHCVLPSRHLGSGTSVQSKARRRAADFKHSPPTFTHTDLQPPSGWPTPSQLCGLWPLHPSPLPREARGHGPRGAARSGFGAFDACVGQSIPGAPADRQGDRRKCPKVNQRHWLFRVGNGRCFLHFDKNSEAPCRNTRSLEHHLPCKRLMFLLQPALGAKVKPNKSFENENGNNANSVLQPPRLKPKDVELLQDRAAACRSVCVCESGLVKEGLAATQNSTQGSQLHLEASKPFHGSKWLWPLAFV